MKVRIFSYLRSFVVYLKKAMVIALTVFSTSLFADSVQVGGSTYQCSNVCSINIGPPMTIQDCCGGTVAKIQREAIVIENP
jgi:hypothetical protein